MINHELTDYVRRAKDQGYSESTIRKKLLSVGWTEDDADKAFITIIQEKEKTLPTPPEREEETPHTKQQWGKKIAFWDVFQYMLLFIMMWAFATSLFYILSGIIHAILPAKDMFGYWQESFSKGEQRIFQLWIALLVVSFPLFTILFLRTVKDMITKPSLRTRLVHRVYVYLTLIIAFFILFSTSIGFLFNVLVGDATWNSLAQVVMVIGIFGTMFGYYLLEIKADWRK